MIDTIRIIRCPICRVCFIYHDSKDGKSERHLNWLYEIFNHVSNCTVIRFSDIEKELLK